MILVLSILNLKKNVVQLAGSVNWKQTMWWRCATQTAPNNTKTLYIVSVEAL